MKLKMTILVAALLLCSGCNAEEEKPIKYVNCKRMDYYNVMDIETNIKIGYQGLDVVNTETIENITLYKSEDVSNEEMTNMVNDMLKAYDEQKKKMEKGKAIEFDYTYDESNITTYGKIDYGKVDVDKLLKEDPSLKDLIEDGKFHVVKMKASYEALGAVCTDLE